MKTVLKPLRAPLLSVLLCSLLAGSPSLALAGVAIPSSSGSSVQWQLTVPTDGVSLRVSMPDGSVSEQEFSRGQSPWFASVTGGALPDGHYVYELSIAPTVSAQARAQASASRDSAFPVTLPAGIVESGVFRVIGGLVVLPNPAVLEPRAPAAKTKASILKDNVVADDQIVQGSLCVGFDCVINESFGFDTIRLKENNTRIAFQDTSTGGFPANAWQLTANDSASGGANKFSIDDVTGAKTPFTVTAGAANNSIFVDSTGRVGLRTATPVLDLHIATSNTPAVRMEQNSSGGFTAQTWDVAGNEANFFVRDVTGGSRLPFRIRPGAPTSSIDIAASGNVGVGTASPATRLHVSTSGGVGAALRMAQVGGAVDSSWDLKNNSDTGRLTLSDDATGARVPFKFGVGAANNLFRVGIATTNTVDVNGTLTVNGTFNNLSSREFKDILSVADGRSVLAKIASLPLFTWSYKNSNGERHFGPVAEDFYARFSLGTDEKHISPNDMAGVALAATQALGVLLGEKEAEIQALKERLARLESRLGTSPKAKSVRRVSP